MKTALYLIVVLFSAGIIFTSCQKDNGVTPAALSAQEADADLKWHDTNSIWVEDPLDNYPDPFTESTTIVYRVKKSGYVSLIVYSPEYPGISNLVNAYQTEGIRKVKFDASNLPNGTYYARLKADNRVVEEKMTKIEDDEIGLPGSD